MRYSQEIQAKIAIRKLISHYKTFLTIGKYPNSNLAQDDEIFIQETFFLPLDRIRDQIYLLNGRNKLKIFGNISCQLSNLSLIFSPIFFLKNRQFFFFSISLILHTPYISPYYILANKKENVFPNVNALLANFSNFFLRNLWGKIF